MARKPADPQLRLHKASGQAYTVLGGKRIYLGRHDAPNVKTAFHRIVAEWQENGGRFHIPHGDITVMELADRFLEHGGAYYRTPDGRVSSQILNVESAVRSLLDLYGDIRCSDFGPKKLRAVQDNMIASGRLARKTINARIRILKRMFRWGASHELFPAHIPDALNTLEGLRKGRCAARESQKVVPVPDTHVDAIEPFVSRAVWGLVRLQSLTAARPGELLKLRRADLDTSGKVWFVQLEHHKTSHREQSRTLYFGPAAQEVLKKFFPGKNPWDYLFSPKDADGERRAALNARRITPLSCGNRIGTNRKDDPQVKPGDFYTPDSYRRAIQRGCWQAGIPQWSPNQLRHAAATRIRREYGLEGAQVILGHTHADTTEIYAQVNHLKAIAIASKMG